MSPEQQIERSVLAGKDREELQTIAGAMGVTATSRMRKADLIEAILTSDNGSNGARDSVDADAKPRRVRSARASELEQDSIAALAEEEDALASSTSADDSRRPDAAPAHARRVHRGGRCTHERRGHEY